jgi:hypothetical protein
MTKTRSITASTVSRVRGRYKCLVLDSSGNVVSDTGWRKNLILDSGMNRQAVGRWTGSFLYAMAGTGTSPTQVASGAITASQTGTTVTLSAEFSEMAGGRLLRWDSGEYGYIVSGSETSWELDRAQEVAAGTFTVYRVNQSKLDTFVKRTATYLAGAGNCGTVVDTPNGVVTMKRTFDFSAETVPIDYAELGTSWLNSDNPDLFSRMSLNPPVSLLADQQLRMVYELTVQLAPLVSIWEGDANIVGWPVAPSTSLAAKARIQILAMSGVELSGGQNFDVQGASKGLEPSNSGTQAASVGLSPNDTPPQAPGVAVARTTGAFGVYAAAQTYVAGSFEKFFVAVFPANVGAGSNFRSITYGGSNSGGSNSPTTSLGSGAQAFVIVFDEPQTKSNTHSLTLRFRLAWERDMS